MIECAYIDLKKNFGELKVFENDLLVVYSITISNDTALFTTSKYELSNGDWINIGNVGEHLTKDDLCQNPIRNELVIWLARGMWGIPLKYRRI
ncbi:MAG TPA: hypothetical protein VH815_10295 [Acidobacteriota bacterium]|jgi:hypothetical protein